MPEVLEGSWSSAWELVLTGGHLTGPGRWAGRSLSPVWTVPATHISHCVWRASAETFWKAFQKRDVTNQASSGLRATVHVLPFTSHSTFPLLYVFFMPGWSVISLLCVSFSPIICIALFPNPPVFHLCFDCCRSHSWAASVKG